MTTEEKIDAVIAQLETGITTIPVSPFPDSPDNYMLTHKFGEVLVYYLRSVFDPPQSDNLVIQKERVEFDITLVIRQLKEAKGAYAYLDLIKSTLSGYQLTGHSQMYPVRLEFLRETNGIWEYRYIFACTTTYKKV